MDSASPDTERTASETPDSTTGVITFFARTFTQAEFAPTTVLRDRNGRRGYGRGRGYRGAHHPQAQATGDGLVR